MLWRPIYVVPLEVGACRLLPVRWSRWWKACNWCDWAFCFPFFSVLGRFRPKLHLPSLAPVNKLVGTDLLFGFLQSSVSTAWKKSSETESHVLTVPTAALISAAIVPKDVRNFHFRSPLPSAFGFGLKRTVSLIRLERTNNSLCLNMKFTFFHFKEKWSSVTRWKWEYF